MATAWPSNVPQDWRSDGFRLDAPESHGFVPDAGPTISRPFDDGQPELTVLSLWMSPETLNNWVTWWRATGRHADRISVTHPVLGEGEIKFATNTPPWSVVYTRPRFRLSANVEFYPSES